jgi:predicted Zn-dependent protease
MMKRATQAPSALLAGALILCATLSVGAETGTAKPGFNLFSVEQDVEIGRQSAAEAERKLPMLKNRNVDRYLGQIITRLAAQAPGARYPYAIKAVNDSAINAANRQIARGRNDPRNTGGTLLCVTQCFRPDSAS